MELPHNQLQWLACFSDRSHNPVKRSANFTSLGESANFTSLGESESSEVKSESSEVKSESSEVKSESCVLDEAQFPSAEAQYRQKPHYPVVFGRGTIPVS
ncbi:hypothetical protein ACLKA6_008692 [Drosophila palustris]